MPEAFLTGSGAFFFVVKTCIMGMGRRGRIALRGALLVTGNVRDDAFDSASRAGGTQGEVGGLPVFLRFAPCLGNRRPDSHPPVCRPVVARCSDRLIRTHGNQNETFSREEVD